MMNTAEHSGASGIPFRNAYVYLVLLIPVMVFGFWKTYFLMLGNLPDTLTPLVHFHAALMILWLLMLVGQAWFIRTRRFGAHRWVGRSSYMIAPLIIWTGLAAIHFDRDPDGLSLPPELARLNVLAFGMVFAYAVTWGLAIVYRRNTPLHVRFMISTAFAIGTAIVWRIFFNWVPGCGTYGAASAGNGGVLSLLLLILIAADWRRGVRRSPFWVVTILIGLMHVAYWTFTKTEAWLAFYQWFADLPSWLFFGSPLQ
jgi:hypothetical protein